MASTGQRTTSPQSPGRRKGRVGAPGDFDHSAILRIRNLELRARVIVEGFMAGLHRSPFHGFSVEFTDYRQYSPGDDPRYLDWKVYARTDRTFIKRFEDETNLRCTILVDQSRSMGFGSLEFDKAEYAKTLAAALAYFLLKQRDAVGVLTFDQQIAEYVPARFRAGQLRQLLLALDRTPAGTSTDVSAALDQMSRLVRHRGMVVLISDLLIPLEDFQTQLGYLVARGQDVVIFRVLDPAEIDFDFKRETLFEDAENARQIYVDPASTRQAYLRRFDEHSQGIKQICASAGAELYTVSTGQSFDQPLLEFIGSRARKTSQLTRRRETQRRNAQNQRRQQAAEETA